MARAAGTALILVAAAGLLVAATPRLQMDTTNYDFGPVVRGFDYTHEFVVVNAGTSVLHLTHVQAMCPCTEASVDDDTLDPGESTVLRVVLDTATLNAGATTKNIIVQSDDPTNPRLYLTVTATVIPGSQPYHLAASRLHDMYYVLIDLRDPAAFADGHLLGAINVPAASLGAWSIHIPRQTVLVLCDTYGEAASQTAATLRRAGYEAYALSGGLTGWQQQYGDLYLTGPVSGSGGDASPADGEIDAATLHELFYVLIDLRTAPTYDEHHLMGALNVAPSSLLAWAASLPRTTLVILYSEDSSDSDREAQQLRAYGFDNAYSLLGGLDYWLATVDDPARPERSLLLASADEFR